MSGFMAQGFWRDVYAALQYEPAYPAPTCLLEPEPISPNHIYRTLLLDGWPQDLLMMLNCCSHPDSARFCRDRERAMFFTPSRRHVLWIDYVLLQRVVRAHEQVVQLRRYRREFSSNRVSSGVIKGRF